MKKLFAMTLALMVAAAFAAPNKVKSKLGDVELTKEKGGGSVVCTAGFNDELTIVKDGDTDVLVKGSCGQGWVPKSKVEYVAALAGDKSMKLDGVDVVGWLDNPSAVFVLENDDMDFDGVNIDRDFKEYLQHTMDRETMEMHNNEN
ncbi:MULTISPECIES: hypothetical protein [unclassified Fibrobacter]|jgi:hypothetical protein|uniref:hypothetical protein n=1 Tax=unclassified Fibrobacter TaxID=2634177 RepID=UPI000BD01852|nr:MULTISPECIES: hypothetical protein [unclassified Fibrobacter]MBO4436846.1 hypothetical protein [Fibrobacter sp.]MBR4007335.1 hypothetical protein [Fibrobacter sp.]SOE76424.1 hypothetical protein SAMN05720781_2118 [Fibrobacter sp. UWT3]